MTEKKRTRLRRRLRRGGAVGAGAVAALLFAFFVLLPWLGRRGDLNAVVESILSSSLGVPVRVASIDASPLSEIRVAGLTSDADASSASQPLRFASEEVSVSYSLGDLSAGRVRQLVLRRPAIVIDLDAGLGALPGAGSGESAAAADLLPYTVEKAAVEKGEVALERGGRRALLEDLEVVVHELGKRLGQDFKLSFAAWGGTVDASGVLDVLPAPAPGDLPRIAVRSGELEAGGVRLEQLLAWALGGAPPGVAGVVSLSATIAGTWPDRLDIEVSGRAVGEGARSDEELSVTLRAQVRGDGAGVVLVLAPLILRLAGAARLEVAGEVRPLFGACSPRLDLDVKLPPAVAGDVLERLPAALLPEELRRELEQLEGVFSLSGHVGGTLERPVAGGRFEGRDVSWRALEGRDVSWRALEGRDVSWRALEGRDVSWRASEGPDASGRALEGHEAAGRALEGRAAAGRGGGAGLPRLGVHGAFGGLRLDPAAGGIQIDWIEAAAEPAEARLEAAGVVYEGPVTLRASTAGVRLPPGPDPLLVLGAAEWNAGTCEARSGDPAGGAAAEATGLEGELVLVAAVSPAARRAEVALEAGFGLKEVLAGSFYADLAGKRLALAAGGAAALGDDGGIHCLELRGASATTPVTGAVVLAGEIEEKDGAHRADLRLEAPAVPVAEAFRLLVREPLRYSAPFLEGSRLDGAGSLAASVRGDLRSPLIDGRLRLEEGTLELAGWSAEGLEIDLPFRLEAPDAAAARGGPGGESGAAAAGALRARRLARGPLVVEQVAFPFELRGATYRLDGPQRLEVLGGTVELREAEAAAEAGGEVTARLALYARGIDLALLTEAADLRPIDGSLDLDLEPLEARGSRLEARGTVAFRAFGGRLELSDLTMENFLAPYSSLSLARGTVEDVSLQEVGEAFQFGAMSGILRGEVTGVELTGGELNAFDLDVQTVPRRGVPQYINRKAVESLQSILAGPFGALEKTFLSKFRYARFGFRSRLANGAFTLSGKYHFDGVEYVMYPSWYQFPRISIINARPDEVYDWNRVVRNLKHVIVGGGGSEGIE